MKRIQFTPDATIRAAEAGEKIVHTTQLAFATRVHAANDAMHYFVGLTPEWWDVVLYLLEHSGSVHGEAVGEGIRESFKKMTICE